MSTARRRRKQLLAETGVRGLMIGRGAIRNPWLFDQIRAQLRGEKIKLPTGRDVLAYIRELWENEITPGVQESAQVMRMKKFMNFIGEGVGKNSCTKSAAWRPRPIFSASAKTPWITIGR